MMMIDDAVLAARVREALDRVAVPAHGPERVLAARDLSDRRGAGAHPGPAAADLGPVPADLAPASADAGPPLAGPNELQAWITPSAGTPVGRSRMSSGTRWALGSVAALVVVALITVASIGSGGGRPSAKTANNSAARGTTDQVSPASPTLSSGAPAGPAPAAPTPTPFASPAPSPVPAGPSPDKVLQTGSLTLTVARGHLDATVTALGNRAGGAGGQVARSQTVEGGDGPSADVTLKVPAGSFTNLLTAVRTLGAASSVNTSATDVTATYVDLTARLNALEAMRAQFLQILAKAQSISDILAVEAQITPLQSQIEQLQGQQQVLDDQASFATLDVHVAVPTTPGPLHAATGGLSGAWAHARHAFARGIESIVSSLGGIAVFFLCVAVLAGLGRITWSVVRRRLV